MPTHYILYKIDRFRNIRRINPIVVGNKSWVRLDKVELECTIQYELDNGCYKCIACNVQCALFYCACIAWWRHQMDTFSALRAICAGISPVPGEVPAQRPVTRSFDVSLICAWINRWITNREAGDLRRYRAHYDVIVMVSWEWIHVIYSSLLFRIISQKSGNHIIAAFIQCHFHEHFPDCKYLNVN